MTKLKTEAMPASLDSVPVSAAAVGFVDTFTRALERADGTRAYQRREAGMTKLAQAAGAFAADLLLAANDLKACGWVFRSMRRASFSDCAVGYRVFKRLMELMLAHRFIEPHEENENRGKTKGPAAMWRATPTFLSILAAKGITPENVDDHFIQLPPKLPLSLRAASTGHGRDKVRGEVMPIPETAEVLEIAGKIKRLNEFLARFPITGARHSGYTRIFNEGDHKDFQWDRGGRLYSKCRGSYQSHSELDRARLTIGGEPVVEIDVRSSFMVILHGLLGMPFDVTSDAYDLEGFLPPKLAKRPPPRSVVKGWTVRTIGLGKQWTRWPQDMIEDYRKEADRELGRDYPIRLIREAMIAKHPIIGKLEGLGHTWATLMFHESEAILGAMVELMDDHQAPSLSVHDSLIVRSRDAGIAKEALTRSYKRVCGLEPYLDAST